MRPSVAINQIFSGLRVQSRVPNSPDGRATWLCICRCGSSRVVTSKRLTTGKTTACILCQDSGAKSPLSVRLKKWTAMPSGCWHWAGKKNDNGYGVLTVAGVETRAHRAMFFEVNPEASRELFVLHKCDNPQCVNPEHLFLGTQAENMKDMHNKGRFKGGAKAGNQNAIGNAGWRKGGITAKYVKDKSCE